MNLQASPAQVKDELEASSKLVLELSNHIATLSITALAAIFLLTCPHTNGDGLPKTVHLLRACSLLMRRVMRIYCSDNPGGREQR